MKSTLHLKACSFAVALLSLAPATFATNYNWLSWTYPTSTTATANTGAGTVNLSVTGSFAATADFPVQFQSVPFTPTLAHSAGAQKNSNTLTQWDIMLDFTALANTTGLIVGIGNLGYGSANYPGYRLTSFDTANNPMPLTGFTVIGNYDYTLPSNGGALYNDDTSLNTANGLFSVTTVPGGDNNNSDMLLLSLPSGVGALNLDPISPSAGDTITFMVGSVPEPSTAVLSFLMASWAIGLRRRAFRKSEQNT